MSMTTNPFHGLRRHLFKEGGEGSLGRRDIAFGTVGLIPHLGDIAPQRWSPRPCISFGVPDIDADRCPDKQRAFSRQQPCGRYHGVRRDHVGVPELAVQCLAAGQARPADGLAPWAIGEPMARKTISSLRHTSTITNRRTTDTHCRQSVGAGFTVPENNCPRAAAVRPGLASPWPARRPASCGSVIDGSPVFWCARGGHGVRAADLDAGYRPTGRRQRAA